MKKPRISRCAAVNETDRSLLLNFDLLLDLSRAFALGAIVAGLGGLNAARMIAGLACSRGLRTATGSLVFSRVGGESETGSDERQGNDGD
jgi:hypothetical protein